MGSGASRLHRKENDSSFKTSSRRVMAGHISNQTDQQMRIRSPHQLSRRKKGQNYVNFGNLSLIGADVSVLRECKRTTGRQGRKSAHRSSTRGPASDNSDPQTENMNQRTHIEFENNVFPEAVQIPTGISSINVSSSDRKPATETLHKSPTPPMVNMDKYFWIPLPGSPPPPQVNMATRPSYFDVLEEDIPPPLPPRPQTNEFLWNDPSPMAVNLAKRCCSKYELTAPISLEKVTSDWAMEFELASSAWNLLSQRSEVVLKRVTKKFFETFFHLYLNLKDGMLLPLRVPVSARKEFEYTSRKVSGWLRSSETFESKAQQWARYMGKFERELGSELAGVATATLLEIVIDKDGPVKADRLVRILISENGKIEGLSTIRSSRIADLFATCLYSVAKFMFPDKGSGPSPKVLLEDFLASANLFSALTNLIGIHELEKSYGELVGKLHIEILPLWLWLVLVNSAYEQLNVADLYAILEGRHQFDSSSLCSVHENIGQFLLRTDSFQPNPFFDELHTETEKWAGNKWLEFWGENEWFRRESEQCEIRLLSVKAWIAIQQAQWAGIQVEDFAELTAGDH